MENIRKQYQKELRMLEISEDEELNSKTDYYKIQEKSSKSPLRQNFE